MKLSKISPTSIKRREEVGKVLKVDGENQNLASLSSSKADCDMMSSSRPRSVTQFTYRNVSENTDVLEGGGHTPWLYSPKSFPRWS